MIKSFGNTGTSDIYNRFSTKSALKTLPAELWERAQRRLDQLYVARDVNFLRQPPGNRLHKLKGNLAGFWSISINDSYRITFHFKADNNAHDVTISNHYGD